MYFLIKILFVNSEFNTFAKWNKISISHIILCESISSKASRRNSYRCAVYNVNNKHFPIIGIK